MSSQASKFSKIVTFSKKYPISRGMASYAVIWPLGSFIQQTIHAEEKYDFAKAARFSLYGCCYVAPTLFGWIKIANTIWPLNTLRQAMTKAIVEQFTYTPFGMVSFYFGMTLLEGKTIEDAKKEVETKFLPTYKVGALVWPVIQTFNYAFIKDRNRIVFISVCSLIWTSYLAYMKHLQEHEIPGKVKLAGYETTTQAQLSKENHQTLNETNSKMSWIVQRQVDR